MWVFTGALLQDHPPRPADPPPPPASADMNGLIHLKWINLQPCIRTWTTTSVKSGLKQKVIQTDQI